MGMRPKARLALAALLIVGSTIYASLIIVDPELARTLMTGYIGALLTVFIVAEVWKKHD